jgi:hypothetical protein
MSFHIGADRKVLLQPTVPSCLPDLRGAEVLKPQKNTLAVARTEELPIRANAGGVRSRNFLETIVGLFKFAVVRRSSATVSKNIVEQQALSEKHRTEIAKREHDSKTA